MSFNVIVTSGFKKHAKGIAKKHRSLKDDIAQLIDSLEKYTRRTSWQRLLQGAHDQQTQ